MSRWEEAALRSDGVRDVRVSRCHLWDSTAGVHIKSGPGRGGFVHDVSLEDLEMSRCAEALMIDTDSGGHPADDDRHHVNMSALPDIRRITARRVRGTGSKIVGKLIGLHDSPLAEIRLENVSFDGGIFNCSEVSGTWSSVEPRPCAELSPTARN